MHVEAEAVIASAVQEEAEAVRAEVQVEAVQAEVQAVQVEVLQEEAVQVDAVQGEAEAVQIEAGAVQAEVEAVLVAAEALQMETEAVQMEAEAVKVAAEAALVEALQEEAVQVETMQVEAEAAPLVAKAVHVEVEAVQVETLQVEAEAVQVEEEAAQGEAGQVASAAGTSETDNYILAEECKGQMQSPSAGSAARPWPGAEGDGLLASSPALTTPAASLWGLSPASGMPAFGSAPQEDHVPEGTASGSPLRLASPAFRGFDLAAPATVAGSPAALAATPSCPSGTSGFLTPLSCPSVAFEPATSGASASGVGRRRDGHGHGGIPGGIYLNSLAFMTPMSATPGLTPGGDAGQLTPGTAAADGQQQMPGRGTFTPSCWQIAGAAGVEAGSAMALETMDVLEGDDEAAAADAETAQAEVLGEDSNVCGQQEEDVQDSQAVCVEQGDHEELDEAACKGEEECAELTANELGIGHVGEEAECVHHLAQQQDVAICEYDAVDGQAQEGAHSMASNGKVVNSQEVQGMVKVIDDQEERGMDDGSEGAHAVTDSEKVVSVAVAQQLLVSLIEQVAEQQQEQQQEERDSALMLQLTSGQQPEEQETVVAAELSMHGCEQPAEFQQAVEAVTHGTPTSGHMLRDTASLAPSHIPGLTESQSMGTTPAPSAVEAVTAAAASAQAAQASPSPPGASPPAAAASPLGASSPSLNSMAASTMSLFQGVVTPESTYSYLGAGLSRMHSATRSGTRLGLSPELGVRVGRLAGDAGQSEGESAARDAGSESVRQPLLTLGAWRAVAEAAEAARRERLAQAPAEPAAGAAVAADPNAMPMSSVLGGAKASSADDSGDAEDKALSAAYVAADDAGEEAAVLSPVSPASSPKLLQRGVPSMRGVEDEDAGLVAHPLPDLTPVSPLRSPGQRLISHPLASPCYTTAPSNYSGGISDLPLTPIAATATESTDCQARPTPSHLADAESGCATAVPTSPLDLGVPMYGEHLSPAWYPQDDSFPGFSTPQLVLATSESELQASTPAPLSRIAVTTAGSACHADAGCQAALSIGVQTTPGLAPVAWMEEPAMQQQQQQDAVQTVQHIALSPIPQLTQAWAAEQRGRADAACGNAQELGDGQVHVSRRGTMGMSQDEVKEFRRRAAALNIRVSPYLKPAARRPSAVEPDDEDA